MAPKTIRDGRSLERAVRLIQESILGSDPKLKGAGFTIESNKIVTVSGVRHEIDVFVKTLPGSSYESTFIFECKDWKDPVGKNEVIILAEKVEAVRANRAFLVARSLTKDAQAQLKLDSRLSFTRCSDEFQSQFNNLRLVLLSRELLPMRIYLKDRAVAPTDHPTNLEWRNKKCHFQNQIIGFEVFIKQHIDDVFAEDQKENAARYQEESTHFHKFNHLLKFEKGEFLVGDMDVEHMTIRVHFWVNIRCQKLFSKFELEDQGQMFSFEPIQDVILGKQLEIALVQRL